MSANLLTRLMMMFESARRTKEEKDRLPEPVTPEGYSETQKVVQLMLTECTGVNPMDAGGDGNRSWQKWRKKLYEYPDLRNYEPLKITKYDDCTYLSLRLWHFMTEHMEFNKRLNGDFEEFMESERAKQWLYPHVLMAEWVEDGVKEFGWTEIETANTYNFANVLESSLQYTVFKERNHPKVTFIIVSVHGGNDIRGGWTDPKVFQLYDHDEFQQAMREIAAWCDECYKEWACHAGDTDRWESDRGKTEDWHDSFESTMEPNDGGGECVEVRHKDCGGNIKFTPHLEW